MKHLIHALALLLALAPAPTFALGAEEMFADPAQEARAREIGRQLRCLKCRNQSIFDSNAGLAKDLRVVVRERMEAGDTDQQILDYVHDRFGDYVLLKPPVNTNTYALWIAPFVLVLLGAGGAVVYMRQRPQPKPATELTDADREEARRILRGEKT
ncbi:cytochrome c-type biogenesis protein CcmH [Seohaeicola saemankumensis]|nr:cytochrome c-type biogenesis protein [Seohaeicola saemankumensis]MCA0873783.1 cytochrome c-type biogenesis protein CcmH [Seohaeicola saemankumensis]